MRAWINLSGMPAGIPLANHLLGRNVIDPVGKNAHEVDTATGDDEGLEAVGAQVSEQFQHRLIDHLAVKPFSDGMLGGRDPFANDLIEFHGGHAGMRDRDDLENRGLAAGERTFEIALEQRGKRLLVLPLRMQRGERLHAVERKSELEGDGLLRP